MGYVFKQKILIGKNKNSKHFRKYSSSLDQATRKTQMKTNIRIATIRNPLTLNAGENVGKGEFQSIINGHVKWNIYYGT